MSLNNGKSIFFFEIGPRLDTNPGDFLNRAPSNLKIPRIHKIGITSARYAMLIPTFIVFQRG